MEQIIIMGRLKKEVEVNNIILKLNNMWENNHKDFIKHLYSDCKEIIGFTEEVIESDIRDFKDEPIKCVESKLNFEGNQFYFKLSRKTYKKNVEDEHMIIESNISYEDKKDIESLQATYNLKNKIKIWLDKYCEEMYWVCDDNNTEICINAYGEIHRIENKFRGILSLYMIRKYGLILLKKDIENKEWYKKHKKEYEERIGGDFNNINLDFYSVGFRELPDLLNMKIDDIKLFNEEISLNAECEFYENDEYIFNENLLHVLDDEYYKKVKESKEKLNIHNFVQKGSFTVYEDKNLCKYERKIDDFKSKWKRLAKLRDIVMHNKLISEALFIEILELCTEFNVRFDDCLDFIEGDFLTEEDYENTQRWLALDREIEAEEEFKRD